ncbi:hypothetical protein E0L36_21640 [Streptomyces sp. AJS327]|uniref:divisome protein SepX/GlpR n=1 Tax=Streptomyces sp. AJS327 TaxID=2545265 RepID=UPI0015E016A2|nr:hypothetical protein [Streptomyces sp. AJS327]MBA0053382.1 hypothetical protein [Streptomyces sp. AJS327]
MSSSGLIYAVIVGAWAAYLVPMWLRRQDELNEARPTERFSTAIRLLSGKAAMERRYAKDAGRRDTDTGVVPVADDAYPSVPDATPEREDVDVRAFADPRTLAAADPDGSAQARASVDGPEPEAPGTPVRERPAARAGRDGSAERPAQAGRGGAETGRTARSGRTAAAGKRAKVLARRRRTTMALFLAFTAGSIVAAVGGLAFLWAPGVPAALLSLYICHLRAQERRRFTVTMDRREAEAAARRLHERRPRDRAPSPRGAASAERASTGETSSRHARARQERGDGGDDAEGDDPPDATPEGPEPSGHPHSGSERDVRPVAADRRALVEQTDHAEWVDQQRGRDRDPAETEGWDPVPVPLPTYVSAPVAPRANRGVDLDAPDTWSSARSSSAGGAPRQPDVPRGQSEQRASSPGATPHPRSAPPDRGRTPLFDQYDDSHRPAANE